jgi:flavin-dependent dehydrogenase
VISVGVVGPLDYLVKGRSNDPTTVFEEEVARCRPLQERIAGAEMEHEVRVLKDFSYASKQVAGNGWVLAGDAFGFIDPIYSSGVFLALVSGEMAADSVHEALTAGELSGERLGSFEPELRRGIEGLRKLVYAFYDPDFHFAKFLERYPHCRSQLIDLLMGNVFRKPVDELIQALDESVPTPEPATA